MFIVGGWRTIHPAKLIAAKGITRPEQLRGGRTITREDWGLAQAGIVYARRTFDINTHMRCIRSVFDETMTPSPSQVADSLRRG